MEAEDQPILPDFDPPSHLKSINLDTQQKSSEFDHFLINEVPTVDGTLAIGMKFHNKDECVHAIKRYHLKQSLNFVVQKSDLERYVIYCSDPNCLFRCRASKRKKSELWVIGKLNVPHTCTNSALSQDHTKLDSNMICQSIMQVVKVDPSIKVKEESYNQLPQWLLVMKTFAPGTKIEMETISAYHENSLINGIRIFHRLFWAFVPCISAFKFCKPMVQVDGTWLYGKYKGTLLVAVAQDGNDNVIPIAYAIVEVSFLIFIIPKPWIFPLAQRFNSGGLNFAKVPHNDVEGYRKTIDHMMVEEFYWRPYLGFQHEVSEEDRATWSACTYLLCYHIVEKHHTDRVTLQFGLHQQIPQPPEDMKSYHEVDMRRGIDDNWTWVWREEINHWNERHNYVLQGNIVQGVLCHSTEYMIWFRQHTKLFISVEQYLRDPRLQPPSYPRVQSTSQSTPQHQYTAGPSSSSPHIHVATEVPFYDPPPSQYYVPSVPEIPTPGYPTEDGLLYNLFGTQCTTPESAYAVFDSMYNQQSQNVMEAGGSGSNPSTTYIEENDQNDDEPEEPQLVQRARRVRRHRTCIYSNLIDEVTSPGNDFLLEQKSRTFREYCFKVGHLRN
uniref:Uncharacterized protein LOC101497921 n=1 Tax=Cicer arietinum TaxID=3827 RepID=A0A3Q7XIA7_CICAR|nr:uncharacterized protein LOC101497921 [Cicer arietinum]